MKSPDPVELATKTAQALETADIPYAIGGALAYAYWGVARATQDVDLNVFLAADEFAKAIPVLQGVGIDLDEQKALESARTRGDAVGYAGNTRIDIFVNSIPLHEAASKRVHSVELDGTPIKILSAEDICVLKMLFFRKKDVLDVERLVTLRGVAGLDTSYVDRWLTDSVGEENPRVLEWRRMIGR